MYVNNVLNRTYTMVCCFFRSNVGFFFNFKSYIMEKKKKEVTFQVSNGCTTVHCTYNTDKTSYYHLEIRSGPYESSQKRSLYYSFN